MGRNQVPLAEEARRAAARLELQRARLQAHQQQQHARQQAIEMDDAYIARRRNLRAQLKAVQAMAAGRAEAAPDPYLPPPQAPNARIAAADEAPPHQPGLANGARQEPAMDPALIWGRVAPAVQVQAPQPLVAPAPIFGGGPGPQLQAPGYGMGHMMQFMPFRNGGGLNQAMDQALAQIGPTFRRSMPFYNYFGAQVPQDVTNQNPHRPAELAPEARPVNLFNDPFSRAEHFSPFGFPFHQIPGQAAQQAVPDNPGAQNQRDPAAPPFGQARGMQHDPIILSSPTRADLVDLTLEDGNLEAGWREALEY